MALSGDAGARQLLEDHAGEVHAVEVDEAGVLLDVDTREALADRLRP
jgi:CTP:molybdopterin cytidylyltransferase MocA